MQRVLGVDCGATIFYSFGGELAGAVDTLRKLQTSGSFDKIYIVSRANPLNRLYFSLRFHFLNFWDTTQIPKDHLYFCWRNQYKAKIVKELNITHFVDDRLDVLRFLAQTTQCFAINPKQNEIERFPETARVIKIAKSWKDLALLLTKN